MGACICEWAPATAVVSRAPASTCVVVREGTLLYGERAAAGLVQPPCRPLGINADDSRGNFRLLFMPSSFPTVCPPVLVLFILVAEFDFLKCALGPILAHGNGVALAESDPVHGLADKLLLYLLELAWGPAVFWLDTFALALVPDLRPARLPVISVFMAPLPVVGCLFMLCVIFLEIEGF